MTAFEPPSNLANLLELNGPSTHERADLKADEFYDENHGLWTRGLLIRRNITGGDLAYFTTWCPAGTVIATLVSVEGHRWAIEDSFEAAKNEFGLDHNETRSWHGWHRQVSLVMLACYDGSHPASGKPPDTQKNQALPSNESPALIRWSIQEIRRIARRLAQRRINPAYVIAWSLWRRAHQAAAQKSHIKSKSQL